MTRIEAGRTYMTRSVCDHDCIFSAKVVKRTAKRATIETQGQTRIVGISEYEGVEQFFPFGKYSMAPVMSA